MCGHRVEREIDQNAYLKLKYQNKTLASSEISVLMRPDDKPKEEQKEVANPLLVVAPPEAHNSPVRVPAPQSPVKKSDDDEKLAKYVSDLYSLD